MNSKRFLILAGPTATGKTKLAVRLAQLFPFELISADSRQVYRQADLVPGKDHPTNVPLAGINLCSPCQTFSLGLWFRKIKPIALQIWRSHHLPLFVGGTGFYLKALTFNIETMAVPPNPSLRTKLQQLTLSELQNYLSKLNPSKFNRLNHSDRFNPRRLIRAIEIQLYRQHHSLPDLPNPFLQASFLFFVLLPPKNLETVIRRRVIKRLELGAIQETKKLLNLCPPQAQVFQSLGYASILAYLQAKLSYSQLIDDWTKKELNYAKRQLIWFKKQPQTIFLPSQSPTLFADVVKTIKTWYH